MERRSWKAAAALAACLGLAFCASGRTKAAKAQEKNPQYQYSVGAAYLQANKVDDALKSFDKSLALNPRFFLAWNGIGLARSIKGDLQGSAAAFEKCLEINPGFSEARNNLGMIYQEMGFPDKAEAEFRKAVEDTNYLSPELPHYNLARLDYTRDRPDDALDEVDRSIRLKPRFALAYNLKGLILERKGDLQGAVNSYAQAVKLVPDDPTFGFNYGAALYKNGEFEKAREILERVSPRVTDPETKAKLREYLDAMKKKPSAP